MKSVLSAPLQTPRGFLTWGPGSGRALPWLASRVLCSAVNPTGAHSQGRSRVGNCDALRNRGMTCVAPLSFIYVFHVFLNKQHILNSEPGVSSSGTKSVWGACHWCPPFRPIPLPPLRCLGLTWPKASGSLSQLFSFGQTCEFT